MEVKDDATRKETLTEPEKPPHGVGAEVMKAAIATELFGEFAGPLTIGRYQVHELLGRGGMGQVYRAWDPTLGRRVALKLLSDGGESAPRRERMLREAQALAKVSHPNVVQVYEVGEGNGDVFLAMELIDGPSLREWLKGEHDLAELENVFVQAAKGLSAAHAAGLIHRDFKPSNVIVGTDGRARVVDFGLAQGSPESGESTYAPSGSASPTPDRLTRTGAVVGTPAYMAPEQIHNEQIDERADQFAFCVALFEAVSGQRPYRYGDLRADPHVASRASWDAVPRRWRPALKRGLEISPGDRWPDIDSLVRALQPRQAWKKRVPWIIAASGLVVAIAPWERVAQNPCDDVSRDLDWDESRAERVARAFVATEAPFASDVWASSRNRVDAFSQSWAQTRDALCESNPSPEAMGCLAAARATFEAVVDQYESVTSANVAAIHPLSSLLRRPDVCLSPDGTEFELTPDSVQLERVLRAKAEVAARRPLEAVLTTTELLDSGNLEGTDAKADVLVLRGRARALLPERDTAAADFASAIDAAQSREAQGRALVAWLRFLLEAERYETVQDSLGILERRLQQGEAAPLEADILELRASAKPEAEIEPRLSDLETALRLREEQGDAVAISRARILFANTLALSKQDALRRRAEDLYRKELEERRTTFGSKHPLTAIALFDLAIFIGSDQAAWEEAVALLREAEQIEGLTLPKSSPGRARTQLKIGEALIRLGRLDEAGDALESAWSVLGQLPRKHSDHVAARTLLAYYTLEAGEYSASLTHHNELASIQRDDPFVQQNIAYISTKLGDAATARAAISEARALVVPLDLDEPTSTLLGLYFRTIDAQVARLEGRPEDALSIVEEIEQAANHYAVPTDSPELAEQHSRLQPELDEIREQLNPTPQPN